MAEVTGVVREAGDAYLSGAPYPVVSWSYLSLLRKTVKTKQDSSYNFYMLLQDLSL